LLSALLLRLDLSEVPVSDLATAVKAAKDQRESLRAFIGRSAATMSRRGVAYSKMSQQTGIPPSTLQHWAKLYG